MALSSYHLSLCCVIGLVLLARPTHAFGAGNIASISAVEGQNWRHGDIEDVLLSVVASRALGKKFGKLDVKRVYFGNWLRDYSQAVDVGTVKYVSAKAITILLWVLGFMSFGYGTGEFEVTMDRLGCYRPEEHIDNPKDYADNEDARRYDRRLRGPVDERRELAIDHETGMKTYIASENAGITTSAGLVRDLFSRCIDLGRRYNRSQNKADLYEALRLLGTGCHCLEDFSAHSNYTELALIELGEQDVFPHVGRNTRVQLRGARHAVYPLITGTFGGVDFLHSVTGEFDDKVTQSEIQELENTMEQAQQNQGNTSLLQDLLNKVPDGIFGGKNEASKADQLQQNAAAQQMQNVQISPREPEEWLRYLDDVQKQIFPIMQFHDEIMQSITETIEKIPILPDLIENIQEQLNVFVFSLLAPFVLPIITQIKSELNTGSSAIIESSVAQQHIVFRDDNSSDPTHSMLSKDHFSNVLNEPAGKIAGQVLKWVVPQLMAAWDDERIDVNRTLNRIIRGVMHHPALRDHGDDGAADGHRLMFGVVEQWWGEKSEREKDELRDQLSRSGVEDGRNHKPGVKDHGHGSAKPLGMNNAFATGSSGGSSNVLSGLMSGGRNQSQAANQVGQMASEAVGGGAIGGLLGGLVGNIGGDLLGGGLGGNKQTFSRNEYGDDGSRTQTITQVGSSGDRYGQAQFSRTENEDGGRSERYERHEQTNVGGGYQSEVYREERTSYGEFRQETHSYSGSTNYGENQRYGEDESRRHGGRHHESREEEEHRSTGYGRRQDEEPSYESRSYGRAQEESGYGGNRYEERSGGYGAQEERRQPEYHRRRDDERDDDSAGGYNSRQDESYQSSTYGQREDTSGYNSGYGRQRGQDDEYGESGGYGSRREDEGEEEYRPRRRSGEEEEEHAVAVAAAVTRQLPGTAL